MVKSNTKTQQETILHFWNIGIRTAKEIYEATKIPMRTIYNNLKKLEEAGNLDQKKGAGRPKKITPHFARSIGQTIRQDPTISLRSLETKLAVKGLEVSYVSIAAHLANLGYNKKLPQATPMLTEAHKQRRVEWAQKHLEDNWNKTLFTD